MDALSFPNLVNGRIGICEMACRGCNGEVRVIECEQRQQRGDASSNLLSNNLCTAGKEHRTCGGRMQENTQRFKSSIKRWAPALLL